MKELKNYKRYHGRGYSKRDLIYPLVPAFLKKRSKLKQAYYLDREFLKRHKGTGLYMAMMRARPLSRVLLDSVNHQLSELLRYEDKTSMAFGIETRLPFLDYRLVEFAFTLDDGLKIRSGQTKFILREAMKDVIPLTILNRHDKIGFAVPDEIWLDNEMVWAYVRDILTSKTATSRGIYTSEGINRLLDNFKSGMRTEAKNIWALVILELWFRIFFDSGFQKFKIE